MSRLGRDDHGVTPIIGTILILAVSVAGIGVTLLLGTPVIQRLQDQAALESITGQFQEVRAQADRLTVAGASAAPGISLPGGTVSIGTGTRFMVTVIRETNAYSGCDLRLFAWQDANNLVNVTSTALACRTATTGDPDAPFAGLGSLGRIPCATALNGVFGLVGDLADVFYCVRAYRLPDFVNNQVQLVTPTQLQLIPMMGPTDEWKFEFLDNDNVVRAEMWLLNTDRLSWSRGGVRADYEAGALFTRGAGVVHLEGAQAVHEGASPTAAVHLRLPMWQASESGAISGSGLHSLRLAYDGGQALLNGADATRLRFDFYGNLAQAWCNAFLQRNNLASVAGDPYLQAADIAVVDTGHQCNAPTPNPDGIRGVVYDPDPTGNSRFPVHFSRQVLHGRLQA